MPTEWWTDHRNLARLATYLVREHDYDAANLLEFLGDPWSRQPEWDEMVDGYGDGSVQVGPGFDRPLQPLAFVHMPGEGDTWMVIESATSCAVAKGLTREEARVEAKRRRETPATV